MCLCEAVLCLAQLHSLCCCVRAGGCVKPWGLMCHWGRNQGIKVELSVWHTENCLQRSSRTAGRRFTPLVEVSVYGVAVLSRELCLSLSLYPFRWVGPAATGLSLAPRGSDWGWLEVLVLCQVFTQSPLLSPGRSVWGGGAGRGDGSSQRAQSCQHGGPQPLLWHRHQDPTPRCFTAPELAPVLCLWSVTPACSLSFVL